MSVKEVIGYSILGWSIGFLATYIIKTFFI